MEHEVKAKLADMELHVEERCKRQKTLVDGYVEELKNQFIRDTIPIPEKIRSMPIDAFLLEYKGDLSSVLPKTRQPRSKPRQSSGFSHYTPSKDVPDAMETPSRRRSLRLQTPSTVRRRKFGEQTFSSNGSPIEAEPLPMPSATKGKLFVMMDETNAPHMNIVIKDNTTNAESVVDITNEHDLLRLKQNGDKEQTRQALKKMQAYLDNVLEQLDSGGPSDK